MPSLREIIKTDGAKALMAYIEEQKRPYVLDLETSSDTVKIYRAQGALMAIDAILKMPEREAVLEDMDRQATDTKTAGQQAVIGEIY